MIDFKQKKMMIRSIINKLMNTNKHVTNEGTVKFFNHKKGFGFIVHKDSDDEIFVHTSNLIDKIKENDKVTFNIEKGEKGLEAVKVSLV